MKNTLISYDPSNGESLGEVTVTSEKQIDTIVEKAINAGKNWREIPMSERVTIIEKAYNQLSPHMNELSELLSREMGKDIRRSSGEVNGTIYGGPYLAKSAMEALKPKMTGQGTEIQYKALGVAVVISPWNYPLSMANNLIVPALVAGNAVIFKPSEETPLIAKAVVDLLNKTLPENVLQIV
ncbi:MAG: aldehyde dehydrogenase family protein, partial [Proteobacteria bacterium]|nr:aldehyde dehydrogenase family protein [Pseudomonadota bacterium]